VNRNSIEICELDNSLDAESSRTPFIGSEYHGLNGALRGKFHIEK
jgi:hypothetical protein